MKIGGVNTIDFARVSRIPKFRVNVKSGDNKRVISLVLLENNIPINLNNYTVAVAAVKSDGSNIFNDVTIIDPLAGVCEVAVTEQMLATNLDLPCELVLYGADSTVASSSNFVISRVPSIRNEKDIVSSSEFNALSKALSEVKSIDNRFNDKANKDEVFSMANMGQDIKEAMTGSSVAVVGKGSVLTENIVNKQVTPITTNFFDIVNFMSLSSFRLLNAYVGFEGDIISSNDTKSIIFKVEENTNYILKFTDIPINRGNIIGSTEDNFTIGGKYTVLGVNGSSADEIRFSTTSNINWVCVYMHTGTDYNIEYLESNKSNIALYKNVIPDKKKDTLKKDFLPEDLLYKSENIADYMVNNSVSPAKTTFFDNLPIIDSSKTYIIPATCNSLGLLSKNTDGRVFILPVEPNTEYIIKFPFASNRNFFIKTNDTFIYDVKYEIVNHNVLNYDDKIYSFTTDSTTKYIGCYCYNGSTPESIIKKDFDLAYSIEDLGKKTYIKPEYINITKNELPEEILFKTDNLSDYIKNKSLSPDKTTFFNLYNSLDLTKCNFVNATCDALGRFMLGDRGKVLILPVESNTKYVIKLPLSSNRSFFIQNSTKEFIHNNVYDILEYDVLDYNSKIYSFVTGESTKYIGSYCYNGETPDIVDVTEYELSDSIENIGKKPCIKDEYINIHKEYHGKKVLTMGDSITSINENEGSWPRSWRKYFKEIFNPIKLSNTAVPGATWRDKEGTIYDGNPVINGDDKNVNNVMGNQLEKLLRARDINHPNYQQNLEYDDDFDIIIIACGTNDSEWVIPTTDEIETQFHNGKTPISNLNSLDRKIWAGAMRYTIDNLRNLYPSAEIYICTPIQRTGNAYKTILDKNTIITNICRRLSVNLIDSMVCGVYDMTCPSMGQEGDFNDGLHLSPKGARKLGTYIANNIKYLYY